MKNKTVKRQSNFELLRIVCMLFIVTYHFLRYIVESDGIAGDQLLKTAWLPLHIAVICFVLISGYFHIQPTIKGSLKLLLPVIVYYAIPCFVVRCCGITDYIGGGQQTVFFLSKSPYWFIKTYFCLYLLSPVLNHYLDSASMRQKVYILGVLLFTSVYSAFIGDSAYMGGKNIALFMTLYVMGDVIRDSQKAIQKVSILWFIFAWLLLNLIIVGLYYSNSVSSLGDTIWKLSFPYSSPILIINAVLFFLIFSRIQIQASFINNIALSVFAVYIITGNPLVENLLLFPVLNSINSVFNGGATTIIIVFLFAVVAFSLSIVLDLIFRPFFAFCVKKLTPSK